MLKEEKKTEREKARHYHLPRKQKTSHNLKNPRIPLVFSIRERKKNLAIEVITRQQPKQRV